MYDGVPREGLSAADTARLDTWLVEIAEGRLGVAQEEAGGDYRVGANRALIVHANGCWHDFTADKGGHGALSLLAHLHGGDAAGATAATTWLSNHTGDGRLGRVDGNDDEARAEANAADDAHRIAYVEAIWNRAGPITGTPGESYLKSRGLDPAATRADAQLRWLSDWRGDEGAMLAAVTDNVGALVALQITHITGKGEKSKLEPARITIRGPHDWRSQGAFRLGSPGSADLVLTEGVEDAISAIMAGAALVHACLGVSGLGRAKLPNCVKRVIVARDDDPAWSPACLALGRGIARLLCQGREVITTKPAGEFAVSAKDINDLLKIDIDLARRQLDEKETVTPALIGDAEIEALLDEVSRVSKDIYEKRRKAIAAAIDWRAKTLDEDRRDRRIQRRQSEDDPVTSVSVMAPWPDPVPDLAPVLDALVAQVKRFLVVPDPTYLDTIALWSAHTYLLHDERFGVEYTPRLAYQSPIHRCGKSTGRRQT
jgi:hypothetical protein